MVAFLSAPNHLVMKLEHWRHWGCLRGRLRMPLGRKEYRAFLALCSKTDWMDHQALTNIIHAKNNEKSGAHFYLPADHLGAWKTRLLYLSFFAEVEVIPYDQVLEVKTSSLCEESERFWVACWMPLWVVAMKDLYPLPGVFQYVDWVLDFPSIARCRACARCVLPTKIERLIIVACVK